MKSIVRFSTLLIVIILIFVIAINVYSQVDSEKNDSVQSNQNLQNQQEFAKPQNEEPLQFYKELEDNYKKLEKNLDRSIRIINMVIGTVGVIVALITLVVLVAGLIGYSKFQELRKEAEESAMIAKESANYAKRCAEEVEPILTAMKRKKEIQIKKLK